MSIPQTGKSHTGARTPVPIDPTVAGPNSTGVDEMKPAAGPGGTAKSGNKTGALPLDTLTTLPAKDAPGGPDLGFAAVGKPGAKTVVQSKIGQPTDAAQARQQLAKTLAALVNIEANMTPRAFTAHVNAQRKARLQRGYFAKAQGTLAAHGELFAAQLLKEKAKTPVDAKEVGRLQNVAQLNFLLMDLYAQLKVSTARKDKFADPAKTISAIATARAQLNMLGPKVLGQKNFAAIDKSLQDLTAVSLAFPTLAGQWSATSLDNFVVKTYRRLQQIDSGARRRKSEPHTIRGALATYGNDARDMRKFLSRFSRLDKALRAGKFASAADYEKAMTAAVRGTSPQFKEAVGQLANAKWSGFQARNSMQRSQVSAADAVRTANSAFTTLQKAGATLKRATANSKLSQNAIKQGNLAGAQEALSKAKTSRGAAATHLQRYADLKLQGKTFAAAAEKHRKLALAHLGTAEAYTTLVESGPYAKRLHGHTKALASNNQQLRQLATAIKNDIARVHSNLAKMDTHRAALQQWSKGLGKSIKGLAGSLSLAEIEKKSQKMVETGVRAAHKRFAQLLQGYDLSATAKEYLKDPTSIAKGDVADVREELAALFKAHPLLAKAVAKEITALKQEFAGIRRKLSKDFGRHSTSRKALDNIEHRVLQGWLANDGIVVHALIEAGASGEVWSQLNGMVGWVHHTHARHVRHILNDPQRSKETAQGFHTWMLKQGEMRERFNEVKSDYGSPVAQVPVSLVVDKNGQLLQFNVYVFKDGRSYKVLNPLDGRVYQGSSQSQALADMAKGAQLGTGSLHYKDDKGVQFSRSKQADSGSIWSDIGMGVVGVIGTVLIFVPEPTTATKWGGGAMVGASSAYFVGKGTLKLIDLVKHETFGNNAQTWGAAIDIAAGVLVFARGAGTLAGAVRTESQIATHLAKMGQSSYLSAAEWTAFAGGLGAASHGLYQVYNDDSLSDKEKLKAGATVVGAMALPLTFVPAARLGRRIVGAKNPQTIPLQDVKKAHETYMQKFAATEGLVAEFAGAKTPQAQQVLRTSLEAILRDAKRLYDAPALKKNPTWRKQGLAEIAKLEATVAKLPVTKIAALSEADAKSIADIRTDLLGEPMAVNTVKGGKRLIESKLDLPEGLSQKEARPLVDKKFLEIVQRLEQYAKDKGLVFKKKATVAEVVGADGKTVFRVQKNYKGHGTLRFVDRLKNTNESITFVSQPKNTGTAAPNRSPATATRWDLPANQTSGMPTPKRLSKIQGTAGDKVRDLRGIRNMSIEEIVARIPKDAELREIGPRPQGGATMGFEFSWKSVNSEGGHTTIKVRIHGIDSTAPAGTNASKGWVVVVEKGGGLRMDGAGNFHPSAVLKEKLNDGNANPSYNADLANNTHIPIKNPKDPLPRIVPVRGGTVTEEDHSGVGTNRRSRAAHQPPPQP